MKTQTETGTPLPDDARRPTEMIPPGVDDAGQTVFFGFVFEGSDRVCMAVSFETLGQIINLLHTLAAAAQQRRLASDPSAAHLEIKEAETNPVRRVEVAPDIAGRFSLWSFTTADGTTAQVHLPLDLMEGLVAHLPSRIAEMKLRQAEHQHQH